MTIDEARHIVKTTKSYTLRRDMLKYIKRKEREKWHITTRAHNIELWKHSDSTSQKRNAAK